MEISDSGAARNEGPPRGPLFLLNRRVAVAWGLSIVVLLVASLSGLLTGGGSNRVVSSVLFASSNSSTLIGNVGALFGLSFAFAAGMVSTVNPCGFVMLPAYLGLYMGTQESGEAAPLLSRLGRATAISLAVGLGFMVVFGGVGIALSAGIRSIVGLFPWIGLAVGIVLTLLAGYVLAGGKLYSRFATQTANRIGDPRDATMRGYFLFGVSYAIASLGCTLPVFLALISSSLATGGLVAASGQFIFYALGMAFVIAVLTVALAFAKSAIQEALRKVMPHADSIAAAFLLVAGAYIVFYWLTEGGLADKIL